MCHHMERFAIALKALGHIDRLRILALLSHGELTVSELVQILNLSQPRVTQYIKSLEAAGILERLREGSWVFSRLKRGNISISALVSTTLAALPQDDPILLADQRRLNDVRAERSKIVEAFFADVANDRGQLGNEYLPQSDIEKALLETAKGQDGDKAYDYMVDLGTGTGRMLELFSTHAKGGTGIDTNVDMLTVARHKLASTEFSHMSVQQGDLNATPLGTGIADLVTIHQVLHYLDDPQEAVREASRLLMTGGTFLIVDFEAHQFEGFRDKYAHRRLGFSDDEITTWLDATDMSLTSVRNIGREDENLPAVKIWRAERKARLSTLIQERQTS